MNTSELLTNLTQQGVQLWVDNDKLSIRSPKGVLTPELRTELATRKAELLALLREMDVALGSTPVPLSQGLSLQTIGRLIGGFVEQSAADFKPPIIAPEAMAQKLTVTFRPLPQGYRNEEIIRFREELEVKLRNHGVKIAPWHEATTDFNYEINLPLIKRKKSLKMRVVKAEINAVIDVEPPPCLRKKAKIFTAEKLYYFYCRFVLKQRKLSVSGIAKLTGWAEDHAVKYVEDPSNTQVIMLTELESEFVNPQLTYQHKIGIGLKTLVRTFSEIVIGVSPENLSILNMNLSDSIFPRDELDGFVLNSLIPKVFVPIMPLSPSRFEIGEYNPTQSIYANKLVALGKTLASTGLFPPGSKLSEVIKRKSHRDIVNAIMNGRTGVSYGFVAYAEAPQFVGAEEINEAEWERLIAVKGFSFDEVRQNEIARRYVKIKIGEEYVYKQIPDIWLVSSRSGANKTDLSLESDITRIGLKEKLFLQLPQGIDPEVVDIKPSFDLYVMMGITLAAALYTPHLIRNGAPIVHFHGYPDFEWFRPNEYCVGVHNPSVPCGTYESGVLNFLGISSLANQQAGNMVLASLIEPDHGTNFIADDLEYLVERLKAGCAQQQIELGGRHFAALKAKVGDKRI